MFVQCMAQPEGTMSSCTFHSSFIKKQKGFHCFKSRWMNMKANSNQAYVPTEVEHIANVITHALWVVPSLVGTMFLIQQSSTSSQYLSAVIYGISLVALFTISTVFHSVFYIRNCGNLKEFLHRCDRAIIYVFIAASYTPWLLLRDMEPNIWSENLWWLVWLMAIMGITYQNLFHEKYKMLETIFYLIMGIAPAMVLLCMRECSGMGELSAGGAAYIVGVVFFKSDGRIPCAHAIWHLFVTAGASCHFYAVSKYLIGAHLNG